MPGSDAEDVIAYRLGGVGPGYRGYEKLDEVWGGWCAVVLRCVTAVAEDVED